MIISRRSTDDLKTVELGPGNTDNAKETPITK
jgi:hypothetical protein